MKIKIDYIPKSEGHVGLEAKIVNGKAREARMDVKEGARLIEGILIGRKFEEIPIITSRICGVCPIVHNITSIKAIEAAFGVKPPRLAVLLRKLMLASQVIQSHSLHLFFLSLSDYFGIKNSFDLAKVYPNEFEEVLKIRNFANKISETIGGRAVHPLTSVVGGFTKMPQKSELENILKECPEVLEAALAVLDLFKKVKFPCFERPTEFIALKKKKEYAVYEGDIASSGGLFIPAKRYSEALEKFQRASEVVNLVRLSRGSYMVGALARLNLETSELNKEAKKVVRRFKLKLPIYNPFYNNLAQMIEIIHFIEETQRLLKEAIKANFRRPKTSFHFKAGEGVGVAEAPRGLLIHNYEIKKDGRIKNARIITPTAQFLFNLEEDLKEFLPTLRNLSSSKRKQEIKKLVRAYDLCISCAVH